jgi:hypothetical protein
LICVTTGFALGTVWAACAAPDVEDDLDTAEDRAAFDRQSRQSGGINRVWAERGTTAARWPAKN